jgi:type II secretory pathway pseudopilin PulG
MFIKPGAKSNGAWTLVEMAVAVGIFSLASAAMASLYYFGLISFASMSNYAILDQGNRVAMDSLTREIREARSVTAYSTNPPSITITVTNGTDSSFHTISYTFVPNSLEMVRNDLTDGSRQVLLTNCSLLNFALFMRCPSNGNFDIYPVATNNWQQTVKAVQFTWKTAISIPQGIVNSEDIQTARIVIRKQRSEY